MIPDLLPINPEGVHPFMHCCPWCFLNPVCIVINLVVCTHGGIVFAVRSYLDFQGKYYYTHKGDLVMPIARIFSKCLSQALWTGAPGKTKFQTNPFKVSQRRHSQNKTNPYRSYDFTMEKAGTNPQQLYPFLMQVMGKSKWIVGNLTRIHIGWPLSSNKVATTTSHHFTLHKHMTCWWNIIMLLSWWSHQMCPFNSHCFNKYMCVFKNIIWIAIYKYI